MSDIEPDEAAKLIAVVWNQLSQKHGWPHRIGIEEVRRSRGTAKGAAVGLNLCAGTRTAETLLGWVLGRWDWRRSPAPIKLAGYRGTWEALELTLRREESENELALQDRVATARLWVRKEVERRQAAGASREEATKRTREFAQVSGKNKEWGPEEIRAAEEELEK